MDIDAMGIRLSKVEKTLDQIRVALGLGTNPSATSAPTAGIAVTGEPTEDRLIALIEERVNKIGEDVAASLSSFYASQGERMEAMTAQIESLRTDVEARIDGLALAQGEVDDGTPKQEGQKGDDASQGDQQQQSGQQQA